MDDACRTFPEPSCDQAGESDPHLAGSIYEVDVAQYAVERIGVTVIGAARKTSCHFGPEVSRRPRRVVLAFEMMEEGPLSRRRPHIGLHGSAAVALGRITDRAARRILGRADGLSLICAMASLIPDTSQPVGIVVKRIRQPARRILRGLAQARIGVRSPNAGRAGP